jgi:uncharacterized membrane protein YphA (DoxX/SURF4 family)
MTNRSQRIASWIAQGIAALILGSAAFFKLTSAPESIAVFEKLGVEPWGRYAVGLYEAVTTVLLLMPRTARIGGLLAVVAMIGAIGAHVTRLGIAVDGDPTMFLMAVTVLTAGIAVAVLRREPAAR